VARLETQEVLTQAPCAPRDQPALPGRHEIAEALGEAQESQIKKGPIKEALEVGIGLVARRRGPCGREGHQAAAVEEHSLSRRGEANKGAQAAPSQLGEQPVDQFRHAEVESWTYSRQGEIHELLPQDLSTVAHEILER